MDGVGTNLLLEQLPETYRKTLLEVLEPVSLALGETLTAAQGVPKYAHFLTSGMISVVMYMRNGDGVEVGMVGHEGIAEVLQLLGDVSAPTTSFVQMKATALRMPFEDLLREFQQESVLRDVILRYVQTQTYTSASLTACNRLHTVEQRMARWLLMVADRVEKNPYHLTQEFLAEMIGASRTTVTLTARKLHKGGLIQYRRGKVVLSDRGGLEATACECYGVIRSLKMKSANADAKIADADTAA